MQRSYKTASSTPMKSHDEARPHHTVKQQVWVAVFYGCVQTHIFSKTDLTGHVEDKVCIGARKTWRIIITVRVLDSEKKPSAAPRIEFQNAANDTACIIMYYCLFLVTCFLLTRQLARWVSVLVPQAVDGTLDGQLGKDVVVGLPGTSPELSKTHKGVRDSFTSQNMKKKAIIYIICILHII